MDLNTQKKTGSPILEPAEESPEAFRQLPFAPQCATRRICVAGGRDFHNYKVLTAVLMQYLSESPEKAAIVSGGANGADALGERYAREHRMELHIYPAEWQTYGKRAGSIRNAAMAHIADELVAFWNGRSHGTRNMIEQMTRLGKPVAVFDYEGHPCPLPRQTDLPL